MKAYPAMNHALEATEDMKQAMKVLKKAMKAMEAIVKVDDNDDDGDAHEATDVHGWAMHEEEGETPKELVKAVKKAMGKNSIALTMIDDAVELLMQ